MIRPDETTRFLVKLFGEEWTPHQLAVCTFKGHGAGNGTGTKQAPVVWWADGAKEASKVAAREAATGHDVYFTCSLRPQRVMREAAPGQYGKAEDVVLVPGLWLDIDMASPFRSTKHELPKTEEECSEIIDFAGLLPSVNVRSGYGFQPWWLFKEPYRINNGTERDRIGLLSKAFTLKIQNQAKKNNWFVDSKQSIASILRLPGMVNYKGAPRATEIESEYECKYSIEEFEESCGRELDLCLSEFSSAAGVHVGAFQIRRGAEPPTEKLTALLCNDTKFRLTWDKKRGRDLKDQSQSGYEMALADAAAAVEWTDQEIVDLLVAHARVKSGKAPEGASYYRCTLTKARSWATKRKTSSEERIEVAARKEAEAREAVEGGPAAVLEVLQSRLGLPVQGFIQTGSDPATYYLDLNGHGRLLLGNADDVLACRKVRAAVVEKTGKVLPKQKGEEWEQTAQLLFSIVEKVEIVDLERLEEARNWVMDYLADQPRLADAGLESKEEREIYKAAFAQKLPFKRDGLTYIYPPELLKHTRANLFSSLAIRDLQVRLFEIGMVSHHVTERLGGKPVGLRYWKGVIGETVCNQFSNQLENSMKS